MRKAISELVNANGVKEGSLRIYFVYNRIGIWCSQEKMPATDLIMYTADLPMRAGPVKLGLLGTRAVRGSSAGGGEGHLMA